jgi:hypothetical protein
MKRLLTLPIALLAVLAMSSTALAAAVKAPIQKGNSFCGANESGLPVIGKVTFSRKGNIVKLSVALKHATPNTTYTVELFGNGCVGLNSNVLSVTTNAKGSGHGKGSTEVPAETTEVFADPYTGGGPAGSNDTPFVSLP